MVLTVCVLRGAGLAVIFVVCGAWGAELVPAERRGEGLGVLGVVAGVPAIIGMPAGLWLAAQAGYPAVFAAAAVLALAGLAALPGLPARAGRTDTASTDTPSTDTASPETASAAAPAETSAGIAAALRSPVLLRPSIVFAGAAMVSGVVATFLPGALPHAGHGFIAAVLLVQAVTGTASRWWAGRFGDRHGAHRLLVPSVVVTAAGMFTLVVTSQPVAVMVGMAVFGAGFGVAQNASMAVMLNAVTPARYGSVAAMWSMAYDSGFGLGAVGFGLLATQAGYPIGFAVTATLAVAALTVLRRRR
jgi:MFS family permease